MIFDVAIKSDNPFLNRFELFVDNKMVGYLEYLLMYDRMEIQDVFITKEYRGLGYGKKLMSYLVSLSIDKRVVNITLEVRTNNFVAISMYRSFGFREVAMRHNYYSDGMDAILMEKQVM